MTSPASLPNPPRTGRVALVDVAFAHGAGFDEVTAPFLKKAGARLAAWVDHHDHPAWVDWRQDARFVLVPKQEAPACPQLVTPELVERLGPFDHVWAHADFDGCVAATKVLLEGRSPYPEADEDARAIDAPGRGFSCSARGRRLAFALDHARHRERTSRYRAFLVDVARSLVEGSESDALREDIDRRVADQERHLARLTELVESATRPHPEVAVLRVDDKLSGSDRKALLRELEERATVAVVVTRDGQVTVATYADDRLDLSLLPGLKGGRGYAWGPVPIDRLLPHLARLLRDGA